MANIYATANNCSSSSSPSEPDDISFFLQKFFLPSSSSTLMQQYSVAVNHDCVTSPVPASGSGRIPVLESSSGLNSSSGCILPTNAVPNLSSSSVGTADNDADALDYDCESEEAIEAMVEEAPPKATPPRSSSKRTRAAEVHNLSEKRRRSRINEKMKALQNLIPNSNKTDKASMLDEAIEYLKQLQLQVQMLTMRNGLSLYPLSVTGMPQPDQISQMRMGINYPGNGSLNVNMESEHRLNQDYISNGLFSLPGNSVTRESAADFSTMMGLKASFELESLPTHHGPLQFARGSSVPFDTRPSDFNDNTLEACFIRQERLEDEQQTNLGHNPNLLPQFNSTQIGERVFNGDIKIETNKS